MVEEAGVDVVLVGDSAANNVLGYADTVPVTVEELLMLTARRPPRAEDAAAGRRPAVRLLRGRPTRRRSATAHRFVKEAGCDAVKLEGGGASAERARAIVRAGVPVMGHVGLTPQTATMLGGYRAQGRTAARARQVLDDALALQEAGCFAIVFEAIPAEVTDAIMPHMEIPIIGIGAGPSTDGQVLVLHDLLGDPRRLPAEVRQALRGRQGGDAAAACDALRRGGAHARASRRAEHTYGIAPEELDRFRAQLARRTAITLGR